MPKAWEGRGPHVDECTLMYLYMRDCDNHGYDPWECSDILFCYYEKHGYVIPIKDGGTSFVTINNCPFCGMDLRKYRHDKEDDQ